MKIQRHVSRRVGDKTYYKWVFIIPSKHVKKLNWKEGEELQVELDKKKLIISKLKDL